MHDKPLTNPDVWRTCNKIRAAVVRSGADLWEWFLPLDPARDLLVPECKFVETLARPALRLVTALTDAEISLLADYFKQQDGRVLYSQLCRLVHGPASAPPQPRPACTLLDAQRAHRLTELLGALCTRVIPMEPYFQDYELTAGAGGGVTIPHFERCLCDARVPLTADDLTLLIRAFLRDAFTVDYLRFLRALDAERARQRDEMHSQGAAHAAVRAARVCADPLQTARAAAADERRALLQAVREAALHKPGVRVAECFQEFDKLGNGRITRTQFYRGLRVLTGAAITPAQCARLAAAYAQPGDPTLVCWRGLERDLDTEQKPEKSGQAGRPAARYTPPKPEESDIVLIMGKIKGKIAREGIVLRQYLQPLEEREGVGAEDAPLVTRANFYSALAAATVSLTVTEMDTLMKVYSAEDRSPLIEYERFCQSLDDGKPPPIRPDGVTPAASGKRAFLNFDERVMLSVGLTRLSRNRDNIERLMEVFLEFDPNRTGYVTRNEVERVLCRRKVLHYLSSLERDTIYKCFYGPEEEQVNYRALCIALDVLVAADARG